MKYLTLFIMLCILTICITGCVERPNVPQSTSDEVVKLYEGMGPTVWHDDVRDVTCYTYGAGGIYCIPDYQLHSFGA